MAVTTEDVEEGVKLLWGQSAVIQAITTNALILGRVQDPAVFPADTLYTSFKVTDQGFERNATPAYCKTFLVEFTSWMEGGAENAGPLKLALEETFQTPNLAAGTTLSLPSGRTLRILHSYQPAGGGGGGEEDEATQQGKSVPISKDRYEVYCQG